MIASLFVTWVVSLSVEIWGQGRLTTVTSASAAMSMTITTTAANTAITTTIATGTTITPGGRDYGSNLAGER